MPPPPVDFSGSDEDVDEEENPEEGDSDVMQDEMLAMEGEEDLDEEEALGKSFPAVYALTYICVTSQELHMCGALFGIDQAYAITAAFLAEPSAP